MKTAVLFLVVACCFVACKKDSDPPRIELDGQLLFTDYTDTLYYEADSIPFFVCTLRLKVYRGSDEVESIRFNIRDSICGGVVCSDTLADTLKLNTYHEDIFAPQKVAPFDAYFIEEITFRLKKEYKRCDLELLAYDTHNASNVLKKTFILRKKRS